MMKQQKAKPQKIPYLVLSGYDTPHESAVCRVAGVDEKSNCVNVKHFKQTTKSPESKTS